jgi:DNA modification methylase
MAELTCLQGDCQEALGELPASSVHCVVTSPSYWGLRDYGVDGQLGLEATPEEYLKLAEKRIRQPREKVPSVKPLDGQMEMFVD